MKFSVLEVAVFKEVFRPKLSQYSSILLLFTFRAYAPLMITSRILYPNDISSSKLVKSSFNIYIYLSLVVFWKEAEQIAVCEPNNRKNFQNLIFS